MPVPMDPMGITVDGSEIRPAPVEGTVVFPHYLRQVLYIPGGFLAGFLKQQQYHWKKLPVVYFRTQQIPV